MPCFKLSEKIFLNKKVKNTVPCTCVISGINPK